MEEATIQDDNDMEDAEEAQVSPRRSLVGPLNGSLPGSILGAAAANGNGFLYEHVPAVPESALEAAVQDVVVSDASIGKPR